MTVLRNMTSKASKSLVHFPVIALLGILRATLHGPQTAAIIAQLTNLVSQ